MKKIQRIVSACKFVWNGDGLELEQRIKRAELDLLILVRSMKAVLLAVDDRVQSIADLGVEYNTLAKLNKPFHAAHRLQHIMDLCKEVGDLKELLDITWQMFDVHTSGRD